METSLPTAAQAPRILLSPNDAVTDAAQKAMAAGVAALRFYEAAAIEGDPEGLHQMRVTIRRMRAFVELFASVLHGSRVRIYRRDLPWLGRASGVVRECDVIESLIRRRSAKLDLSLGRSLAPIYETLAARRRGELARVAELLRSPQLEFLTARLAQPRVRKIPPSTTVRVTAPAMLQPIVRAVARAGNKLDVDPSDRAMHHLRIKLKRLRYALEMLEGLTGASGEKMIGRLRDLQDLFGMHQDAVNAIAWLREFAASENPSPPSSATLAAGALIQSLIQRRDKLGRRGCKRWKRFNRSGIMRETLAEISQSAKSAASGTELTVKVG